MKILKGVIVFCLLCAGGAQATTVVDTGQPTSNCCFFGLGGSYFTEGVQFTLSTTATVTSVQSFFSGPNIFQTGPADILAHGGITANDPSGFSDLPGAILHESTFTITQGSTGDWFGTSGTSWLLGPGTYWGIFWVDPNDCNNCRASIWSQPPSPLPSAYGTSGGGTPVGWVTSSQNLGLRVETSAVPVPAAVWLFGSGLLGLVGIIARRKKA